MSLYVYYSSIGSFRGVIAIKYRPFYLLTPFIVVSGATVSCDVMGKKRVNPILE